MSDHVRLPAEVIADAIRPGIDPARAPEAAHAVIGALISAGYTIVDRSALVDAEEAIAESANYLKDRLDEGEEIHESKWLDGLMEAHGLLGEMIEHKNIAPDEAAHG